MRGVAGAVALAIAGVVAGTIAGSRALGRIPDIWFRRVLALLLALLGVAMLSRAVGPT